MKKLISMIALSVALVLPMSGCGTKPASEASDVKMEIKDLGGSGVQFEEPKKGETIAEIVVKDYGSMYVKFFEEAAPKAVENFVTHAKDGYYDGLKFHRIIDEFMIQGGDPMGTGVGGESIWGDSFEDEFSDDLQPYRGALCMANSGPNTNGSQFFIVQNKKVVPDEVMESVKEQEKQGVKMESLELLKMLYNTDLTEEAANNYMALGGTPWLFKQHTVFGQMISGYDVLDKIAAAEVDSPETAVPIKDVIIEKINITENK